MELTSLTIEMFLQLLIKPRLLLNKDGSHEKIKRTVFVLCVW